jgi:hypothetical protein
MSESRLFIHWQDSGPTGKVENLIPPSQASTPTTKLAQHQCCGPSGQLVHLAADTSAQVGVPVGPSPLAAGGPGHHAVTVASDHGATVTSESLALSALRVLSVKVDYNHLVRTNCVTQACLSCPSISSCLLQVCFRVSHKTPSRISNRNPHIVFIQQQTT